jgi:hypothetical protein
VSSLETLLVVLRFECFQTFLDDERYHCQCCDGISPPPTDGGIQEETD